MFLNKKRFIYALTSVATVTSVALAISCSTNGVENKEVMPLNTLMQKQTIEGQQEIGFLTFMPEAVEKVYGKALFEVEPKLIATNSELDKFLTDWNNSLIKVFDQDQDFAKTLYISKTKLVENLNLFKQAVLENYNDDYFKNNIMVVDFGGQIQPRGRESYFPFNGNMKINNLLRINKEDNKIVLTYLDSEKINYDPDYAQTYSVIYSLNRSGFNLNENNYEIEKRLEKPLDELKQVKEIKKTDVSQRYLNYYSYISQDLSLFDNDKDSIWARGDDEVSFATTIVKSKSELDNLLNKHVSAYKIKYEREFPDEVLKAINQDFNESYFQDNVLVLLSGKYWAPDTNLFSKYIENSYDLKHEGNNLNFTIFVNHTPIPVPTSYVYPYETYYERVSDRYKESIDGNGHESHTQFFKLAKSSVTDFEKLKSAIKIVDNTPKDYFRKFR
ncbi:hypothetical protein ACA758_01390 [Mycoplasmopsis agassizii]|uniref:hypothetical protein n=1 Tax=Mycoplasmopsis agassizii TaxID=33922 RepID=UPI0035298B8E